MKKLTIIVLLAFTAFYSSAQPEPESDTSWKKIFRESAPRINDLVHTKLEVKFDYSQSRMNGKAWITLRPHFYSTDSLRLDAKGMDIHKVGLVKGSGIQNLVYKYDGWSLWITLDKKYTADQTYTVFIDYTAKPDEVEVAGSAAINDAKGLYFINPKGEDKTKPTQIWTQGETEATSVWCPTIDRPNQKTTQEIYMTVPSKYVTLSNGKLVSQKNNADGTRTDYWKMDLPHAPYLFFMGVGDYAIIKDTWKGKEVSYYVEKEYASVARKIFGHTPEMMTFYSKLTGIDYPWVKYAQITGVDYVSGAMENTTATLHGSSAQRNARQLTDGNPWEETIAHELFHQWFGDYVTAESWSNITMNESFANYSEVLWQEYKYGKDLAHEHNFSDMQVYLTSNSADRDLVRFYYSDKEDVFDAVSYHKGGRILHMLRNYVGPEAFSKALNVYLTTNKFKSGEPHQLRLAFEEVTGRDLNWFWNQWYFGSGHPDLDINYSYDANAKKAMVIVNQKQAGNKIFRLPVAVDIYNGSAKTRHQVWVENKIDTFLFDSPQRPELVNFDGDKMLLATKSENKTIDEYIHQFKYAGGFVDRREALEYATKHQSLDKAVELLQLGLKDRYEGIRLYAAGGLDIKRSNVKKVTESTLVQLARTDPSRLVKAAAIANIGKTLNREYASIYKTALNDSSYTVAGNALDALANIDMQEAMNEAKKLSKEDPRGKLASVLTTILIGSGDASMVDIIMQTFEKEPFGQDKFTLLQNIAEYISRTNDMEAVRKGVDGIVKFRDSIGDAFKSQTDPFINGFILKGIIAKKVKAGLKEQAEYVNSKLPVSERRGF
ncbi:MAG: M1 family metallopeptidase [Chitinophagaceae bacterium]|nr:M1 family metallopeptidase [Chitinophagaceae bacterium]